MVIFSFLTLWGRHRASYHCSGQKLWVNETCQTATCNNTSNQKHHVTDNIVTEHSKSICNPHDIQSTFEMFPFSLCGWVRGGKDYWKSAIWDCAAFCIYTLSSHSTKSLLSGTFIIKSWGKISIFGIEQKCISKFLDVQPASLCM